MASLIDPSAQFDQRCKEIGLSSHAINRLQRAGIVTLGVLAYSHGQPGASHRWMSLSTTGLGTTSIMQSV